MFLTFFFKKNHNFTDSIAINVYQVSMLPINIAVYRKIISPFLQHLWIKSLTGMHQPETRYMCAMLLP